MIAIPAPLLVDGEQEEIGPLHLLQQRLPGAGGGGAQGIAEGSGEPVQDRARPQEGQGGGGLRLEDILQQ